MHPWSWAATKLAGQLRRSAEACADTVASYAAYEHLNLSDWSASPPDDEGEEASIQRAPDFPEEAGLDAGSVYQFRDIGVGLVDLRIVDDFEIDGILQLVEGPCLGERARTFRAERLARKAEDAAAAAAAAEREAEFERREREVEAERAEARRKLEAIRQAERDRRAAAEEEARKAAEAERKRKEEMAALAERAAAEAAAAKEAAAFDREIRRFETPAEREQFASFSEIRFKRFFAFVGRFIADRQPLLSAEAAWGTIMGGAYPHHDLRVVIPGDAAETSRWRANAYAERHLLREIDAIFHSGSGAGLDWVSSLTSDVGQEYMRSWLAARSAQILAQMRMGLTADAAAKFVMTHPAVEAGAARSPMEVERNRFVEPTAAVTGRKAGEAAAGDGRSKAKEERRADRERHAIGAAAQTDGRERRAEADAAPKAHRYAVAQTTRADERTRSLQTVSGAGTPLAGRSVGASTETRFAHFCRFLCDVVVLRDPPDGAASAWGGVVGSTYLHYDIVATVPGDPEETNWRRARAYAERHLLRVIEIALQTGDAPALPWVSSLSSEGGQERIGSWLRQRTDAILAQAKVERSVHVAAVSVAARPSALPVAEIDRTARLATVGSTPGVDDSAGIPARSGPAPEGDGRRGRDATTSRPAAGSMPARLDRSRRDDYWARVRAEIGMIEDPASRKWAAPDVVPTEPGSSSSSALARFIDEQERLARERAAAASAASGPSGTAAGPKRQHAARRPGRGKSAGVVPPVLSSQAGSTFRMQDFFRTAPSPDLQTLVSRMAMLDEQGVLDTLLSQFAETFPEARRRRGTSRTDPEFSDIVAAMMSSGIPEMRFLLLHNTYPGVAMIDVRCPRPQLVAAWSRCIAAAGSYLPSGRRPPSPALLDKVANLRLGLRISELTRCLLDLDLHLVIGRTESA